MFHVCFDVFGVFYTCIVLGLISLCHAQSQLMGPLHPVVARADDDITLLCYTEPAMDASDMTVEWSRPDLDLGKRLVYVWPERPELQNPPYKGRTSLFIDEMKYGNISLKISRVKLSDEGKYRCFVPDLRKDFTVQLIVGVASSPVISLIGLDEAISGVVLQCESAGWYPEPELLWLDGEGNLLSAGPTETLGGPDDFYTVSSRVTVEKRHSNNITCRVQQRNTNQSRETHIHVPDDFFSIIRPPSNPTSDPNIIISLVIGAVVVLLILTVVFVWKKRQAKCKKKKSDEENRAEVVLKLESEALMTGREEEEDDMDNRGEKNFKVERETHQDDHETETEQRRDTNSPQERRIYPSTVIDKESLIRMEHKTQDMTGREEDNDADSREEQRHEDERETQQDHFVLEIEQIKDINSLQEKRINSSTVIDKESLITIEEETQDMTGGEEEDDVYNSGEKKTQKKMLMKKKKNKKKQSKAVDTDSPEIKTSTATEKDPQFEKKKDTHEEQSMRRRHEITYNVDTRGEDRNTFHLSTDQEPLRGKDTQQDQFVLETEQMNDINSPQEKRINQCTVIDKESLITIEQQKGMKAEGAEGEREKKMETGKNYLRLQFLSLTEKLKEPIVFGKESKSFNFSFHLSSDQEPWREKETQQELLVEKRQMERNVDMKKSDTEKTRAEENSGEVNNLYSVFMAQKETQREKLEAEQQRENQRRLQSETRRERERDEIELKIRKDNKTQHYTDEKTVKTRRILKARRHQNPRKVKGCVENQNDDHMEVDDFAHQNAATPQLYETIRWTKDQEKLPVQSEPQEYLKENNEVLEDQMEVD